MSNIFETIETRYAKPYIVQNGCLFREVENKDGLSTRKLCNFVPYLDSEFAVDTGSELLRFLTIAGIHESGRILEPIRVGAKDFASLNWITEMWGAQCNLEIGRTVKEQVRHAIQTTEKYARKKRIYNYLGWTKIQGEWHYLMPQEGAEAVELDGKLKNYGFSDCCEIEGAKASLDLIQSGFIEDDISFPLLALCYLSPVNEFLRQAKCEPKTILYLLGKTGKKKSTLAALFISHFGNFSAADLPMSFRDTGNSIVVNAHALKDVLTVIDDYHPSTRNDAPEMTRNFQMIARAYGDRMGRNRLRNDATLLKTKYPRGNVIITGEQPPDITQSGTARYLTLELEQDVNVELLSQHQNEAAKGLLAAAMKGYIDWLKAEFLSSNDKTNIFTERLALDFEETRKVYTAYFAKDKKAVHPRIPESITWLMLGMDSVLKYFRKLEIITVDEFAELYYRADMAFRSLGAKQANMVREDRPTERFIDKFVSLLQSGKCYVVPIEEAEEHIKRVGFVGYEDEFCYYLILDSIHAAVKRQCDEQGETFAIPSLTLLKQLRDENYLECGSNSTTKIMRIGKKQNRFVCIVKSKIKV